MPTARPSISATVGTVESMSTKPVTAVIPMIPTATPISAVNSGSPAATSEPNVIASTSAATAKPRISPIPPTSGSETAASPPNSTCTPDACAVSAAFWTASTDPSGMSSAAFAHVTWASATWGGGRAVGWGLWGAVGVGRSFGWGAGCSLTIEVAARRDDRRRSPSAWPVWTHPVPPLGGRAEGYDGLVPRRADVLWAALAIALALALQWADASGAAQVDREPDLLGALLTIAACAPVAVRRARPLAAAVAALAFACAALALGYMVIVPVLVGLALCSRAAIHSAQRVTVPLGAYAGTLMAAAVTITGDDSPVPVRILLGLMIGVSAGVVRG